MIHWYIVVALTVGGYYTGRNKSALDVALLAIVWPLTLAALLKLLSLRDVDSVFSEKSR